jgi:hypothetical protein
MGVVEVLIQNVSSQCIPNLVAIKSFKPKRVIWVYTDETTADLQRLKDASHAWVTQQEQWLVDARDSELLQQSFKAYFEQLSMQGKLVFHLTCGTKSMALQGMMQLAVYRQKQGVDVCAVVMDPNTQYFDVVFPLAQNNAYCCQMLAFDDVLKVHGSWRHKGSGRDMNMLRHVYEPLDSLRALHTPLMQALDGRSLCSAEEAKGNGYFLRGGNDLPGVVQEGLFLAQDAGVIKSLAIKGAYFSFESICCENPYAYIRNMWMEDWVGAVLAKHGMKQWSGGYSSVKVSIQSPEDYQEFDFLGVRKNHLVYWSCKNTSQVKAPQLFEIDALRDEVGGRDFHVAGLVHAVKVPYGLKKKAKRLGLHLVQITAPDAQEKLIRASMH